MSDTPIFHFLPRPETLIPGKVKPGVKYAQISVENITKFQAKGYEPEEGVFTYVLKGTKGEAQAQLWRIGTPIPGQDLGTTKALCSIDWLLVHKMGDIPADANGLPAERMAKFKGHNPYEEEVPPHTAPITKQKKENG